MIRRVALVLTLICPIVLLSVHESPIRAQAGSGAGAQARAEVPRAIRRDVPITNAIRRAFEAGTRDTTGRPGPNYWQLADGLHDQRRRLDPATDTLTGTETIALHNNSPQELTEIMLRLDHNIFRGLVPRGTSVPAENTDGMVVTSIDGERRGRGPDRTAAGVGGGRGRGGSDAPGASRRIGPRPDAGAHLARDTDRRRGRMRRSRSPGTRNCPAARTAAATA